MRFLAAPNSEHHYLLSIFLNFNYSSNCIVISHLWFLFVFFWWLKRFIILLHALYLLLGKILFKYCACFIILCLCLYYWIKLFNIYFKCISGIRYVFCKYFFQSVTFPFPLPNRNFQRKEVFNTDESQFTHILFYGLCFFVLFKKLLPNIRS